MIEFPRQFRFPQPDPSSRRTLISEFPGAAVPRSVLLAVVACLGVDAVAQQNDDVQQALSVGAYYASGDYGEPVDTDILYIPFTYEANLGKWGFQLMVPHLQVEGLGNVLINIGGVTQAVAGDEVTTNRGLGDTVASVIYRFDPLADWSPFVDFRLDVKLPTADENKSLGTGETDYSMQLDFTQAFGDLVGFATAGYNFRGKSSLYAGLEDSAFAQLGVAYPLTASVNAGVYYDFREPASTLSAEVHEIVPYFSWQIDQRWSFTALTSWGFTDASADAALLGQLRYQW